MEDKHLIEIACTLLIVPMNLMPHFQQEGLSTIPMKMYLQTLCKLHTKEKVKKRKGTVVAAPTAKKRCASNPHCPALGTLLFSLCQ